MRKIYECFFQPVRRASLIPPPEKDVTWEQYIQSEVNNYPRLGRDLVYKESSKSFKAIIAMVKYSQIKFKQNLMVIFFIEF